MQPILYTGIHGPKPIGPGPAGPDWTSAEKIKISVQFASSGPWVAGYIPNRSEIHGPQ